MTASDTTSTETTATVEPKVLTWNVVSPSGYTDNPVTALSVDVAIADVEARGHKVVDVMDDTIVIADEPAATEPAKPARRTRSTARAATDTVPAPEPAAPKFRGQAVDGYAIAKTTAGFDQLAKAGKDAEGPAWLTRCNAHGSTAPAGNRKAGRGLGSAAQRATWCRGCKTAAAKTAAAK